ncbi:hypothetical protein MANES_11G126050v8 [Manihot esculenta]|uniref:Uncharacterized protein n=1 Tax=Manihot esculenta TaxID=3983 RepID=A0ACB7GXB5_MANES|nr:hypothetical protein MANES_11G126050v8 [Manihot esculenta]
MSDKDISTSGSRGVNRIKQHLAGCYKNMVRCPKCPEDVWNQIQKFMSKKREQKAIMHIENVEVLGGSENEENAIVSKKFKVPQNSNNREPLDSYFSSKLAVLEKNMKQTTIDENNPAKKELRANFFGEMIRTIGNYGRDKCSLMCDGWTVRRGRTLINFLINCLKEKSASSELKLGVLLAGMIEKELLEIGPHKIVQVVTNNTSYAAHCIDLMLEDIFKIRVFKETFRKDVELNDFIFITLGRIHLQKMNIRKIFTLEIEKTVLSPSLWNYVVYALKVFDPLVLDILLDEIEYKETIGSFRQPPAIRGKTTRSPTRRWRTNFQKFAVKVLSLTCSASSCERNWSIFEHLHSKKRNRLAQDQLNSLLYVKYNRALLHRYIFGNRNTPIDLENIDESNEWLIGELEKDNEDDDDDLVFVDDMLTWGNVGRAAGVSELRYKSRSLARSTPFKSSSNKSARSTPVALPQRQTADDDEEEEE